MEYMQSLMQQDKPKRDLILFPHRVAAEKQVEIFRNLAAHLPQYEFLVCQDSALTKQAYHDLLAQAKMVFSASLQETLGISTCSEGPLSLAVPLAPNRLSYREIFQKYPEFLYPEEWTQDWDSYVANRHLLIDRIVYMMSNYDSLVPIMVKYNETTHQEYFTAQNLLKNFE
jgi:hypothetical protein